MSMSVKEIPLESGAETSLKASQEMAMSLTMIQEGLQVATAQAVDRAYNYAEKLSRELLNTVKEELNQYAKPKQQILVVEVDSVKHKLTKPATKHLGRLLVNAKLGLNSLLVGPAGSGKTIAAEQVAEALGLEFSHLCLTAGASETWLFGRQTPNGFIEAGFSERYRKGGVFLADEIDGADANLLLCLNTALSSATMYNPISGEKIPKHEKFVCIGAANTVGKGSDGVYTGRSRLDGSTLNRFVPIQVDYCSVVEEQVCPDKKLRDKLQKARAKLREIKSQEIISTRTLAQAYAQKSAEIPLSDIFGSITLGWSEELVKTAGLMPPAEKPVTPAGQKEEIF